MSSVAQFDPNAIDLLQLIIRSSSAGCQLEVPVSVDGFVLGAETYEVLDQSLNVTLNCSRVAGHGWALHIAFAAEVVGGCMRCLGSAVLPLEVEGREVHSDDETDDESFLSPYVVSDTLDLSAWVYDAIVLNLPTAIVCSQSCKGLCSVCGGNLNKIDRHVCTRLSQ